ncbi:MAG: hypothetical protein ACRDJH_04695 [Thermomicrobiales bacterium]
MNRTTLIIVGLALAASVGIGGMLGQLSGDDGDEPEATRPALSAPAGTADSGTPGASASPVASPMGTPTEV